MIPKSNIDEMREHFTDFKKFPKEEYFLIFSRILDNLQKISNIVGSNCSNLQNFLNFLKYRLLTKNIFDSKHLDYKNIKHLTGWIALHLKRHHFTKAGIDMGKLLSILAENIDYNTLKEKTSVIMKKRRNERFSQDMKREKTSVIMQKRRNERISQDMKRNNMLRINQRRKMRKNKKNKNRMNEMKKRSKKKK